MRYLLIAAVLVVGCSGPVRTVEVIRTVEVTVPVMVQETKAEKKTYTKEEFHALVFGKTKDEVVDVAGKPDKTSTRVISNEYIDVWEYRGIVHDKYSKNPQAVTELQFGNGMNPDKKLRVNFVTP